MFKSTFSRQESGLFSEISNELTYNQNKFKHLIESEFSLEAFKEQISKKSSLYSMENRTVLVDSLQSQYSIVPFVEKVSKNIELLKLENTFTITTGHQLNLLTGPMYFIYKILHIINLSEKLKQTYPENNFVPVFWMASEDHDFEEINHTNLFNRKISWEEAQGGPVGTYDLIHWNELITSVKSLFSDEHEEIHKLIESYDGNNLSEATFKLVHTIFSKYGLVIIEPNVRSLKQLFKSVMKQEVLEQIVYHSIGNANKMIEEMNYKPQVFAREINLFYISKGIRNRLKLNDDSSITIDGVGTFSKEDILIKMDSNPERFSPNVTMRPIYQEVILPNLAYIGGGGEIAYWLQLKSCFNAFNIQYPLIQVRNSVQIIDSGSSKKMDKLELGVLDIFKNVDQLKREYVQKNSTEELDFSKLDQQFLEFTEVLENQILVVDASFSSYVEAEKVKLNKQIESIKTKLHKHQKGKMDQSMKQIEDLKNKLFPNGSVQERSLNFLNFCANGQVESFIDELKNHIEPFENDLIILKQ